MNILRTPRTIVDRISLDDAAFFVSLLNTPGWLQFIGDRQVNSIEDARGYLETGLLATYRDHGFGYYLVKTPQAKPFGICGFLSKPHLDHPDFGFAQLAEYDGRGLAQEYAAAVLAYGHRHHHLNVVDAEVLSSNTRSIRLLRKLGFRRVESKRQLDELTAEIYRWTADPADQPCIAGD